MKEKELYNMRNTDLDNVIGKKLDGYTEYPPHELFARIEKSIEADTARRMSAPETAIGSSARQKKRSTIHHIVRAGIAAAILAGLVLGYRLLDIGDSNTAGGEGIATIIPDADNSADNTNYTLPKPSVNELSEGDNYAINITATPVKAPGHAMDDNAHSQTASDGMPHNNDRIPFFTTDTYETSPHGLRTTLGTEPVPALSSVRQPYGDTMQVTENRRHPIDIYWDEILRSEEQNRRGRRIRSNADNIFGSLYAGNFGVGDFVSSDAQDLVLNKMAINETSGIDDDGSTILMSPSSAGGPKRPKEPAESELTHRMPVSFGLSLGIPLSDRFTLLSGLNYSRLSSYSAQTTGPNTDRLEREAHYFGIPIAVSYTFLNSKRLGFYGSAGGMIEKAVYAVDKTTFGFDSGNTEQSKRLKVRGVTPSVNAALGVSLRLYSGLSIYLEPGVSYYFERANALPSYRTQHPLSFSLSAGVRFGF